MLRKLKARAVHEGLDGPVMKRKIDAVRWLRCVKLERDPMESDRLAFMSGIKKDEVESQLKTSAPQNDERTNDDDEDADADPADSDDDLTMLDTVDQVHSTESDYLTPQWTMDTHYSNLFFDVVHASGPQGISSMVCSPDCHV